MKQVFFRLIWTFWLLLLGSLLTIAQPNEKSSPSVTSVHCAPVIAALTFSYDEQNIPSVAYDTQPRTKFGYDVPLLHARGEGGIWSAGGCALLVDLANGLAAKGPVRAFEVGTADDLLARSIRGDKLDIHHVGQAHPLEQIIPSYNRATAPAIAVPRGQHSTIPTVRGPYTGTARDQLAKDIRDLRNYTDAPNSSLRELIDLNKQTYPTPFQK